MRTSKKMKLFEQIHEELAKYRKEIDPIIKQMIDNKEINSGCYYNYMSYHTGGYHAYARITDKLTSAKNYRNAWNSISIWNWNYALTSLQENRKNAEQFIQDIRAGKIVHGKYGYTYEQIKAMEVTQ